MDEIGAFEIGDFVFLKLLPYCQTSFALRRNLKLTPKYYGLFEIMRKIGPIAYKLTLLENPKLHPFHVSWLKKVGENIEIQNSLPILLGKGDSINHMPEANLD